MFSYIKGLLAEISEAGIVVEAGSIGWQIYVPLSVLDRLPKTGEEVKIFTSFQVREDAMTLYGFLTRQDRQMFEQLLGVSGIGPKAALGILSALQPDDLRMAIVSEDVKAIAKAPGIGPKTARRVILELKDKIRMEDILPGGDGTLRVEEIAPSMVNGVDGAAKEAVEALVALGYSMTEAARAVSQVPDSNEMTTEAILKASLKYLAF